MNTSGLRKFAYLILWPVMWTLAFVSVVLDLAARKINDLDPDG